MCDNVMLDAWSKAGSMQSGSMLLCNIPFFCAGREHKQEAQQPQTTGGHTTIKGIKWAIIRSSFCASNTCYHRFCALDESFLGSRLGLSEPPWWKRPICTLWTAVGVTNLSAVAAVARCCSLLLITVTDARASWKRFPLWLLSHCPLRLISVAVLLTHVDALIFIRGHKPDAQNTAPERKQQANPSHDQSSHNITTRQP